MKRWICLLLAATLAAGITAGCGSLQSLLSNPASQSSASQSSASSKDQALDVMKPPATPADMLDYLAYEKTQSKDAVGWLYIPDTSINSAVVQSHDNSYYLRITERGQPSIYGCYFADYTCNFGARDALSPNTVIYGHSDLKDSKDGPKFSQLFQFTDQTFAEKHPALFFSTEADYMVWQVFAAFYTEPSLDYIASSLDTQGLEALIATARERSLYQYDVEVTGADKILTLSTCSTKYGEDDRFVVMAKLMPEDYDGSGKVTLKQNPSPVLPGQSQGAQGK